MKDISFKENIVKKNKIPILIYTPDWIQLFHGKHPKSMQKVIDRLEEYLSKEKSCEAELKELEKRKKVLVNKILYLSNQANENNDEKALEKMEEAQKEILYINRRIPELFEELETLPGLINQQNTLLLKETIKVSYEIIKESKEESAKTQEEVNRLREKIAAAIQKKVELEEKINHMYSFLHGLVGASEMENLDESFLE